MLSKEDLRFRARGFRDFWRRYKRNRAAVGGLVVMTFFLLLAVFGSIISPYGPEALTDETFMAPSQRHLMGTDNLGRDIYSRVVDGTRISLMVGSLAALTSMAIGVFVGATAGYYGGRLDEVLMRLTEGFQVMPSFFLALLVAVYLGASIWNIIWIIGILSWPSTARLVRAEFLALREREFVLAGKALGINTRRIVFEEILPNASPPVIVNTSLQVAAAILVEAGLSFLGLGDPRLVSWGRVLYEAQRFLRTAWWMSFFPGIALFLSVLALNLIGDGLNDALNPRLRER